MDTGMIGYSPYSEGLEAKGNVKCLKLKRFWKDSGSQHKYVANIFENN